MEKRKWARKSWHNNKILIISVIILMIVTGFFINRFALTGYVISPLPDFNLGFEKGFTASPNKNPINPIESYYNQGFTKPEIVKINLRRNNIYGIEINGNDILAYPFEIDKKSGRIEFKVRPNWNSNELASQKQLFSNLHLGSYEGMQIFVNRGGKLIAWIKTRGKIYKIKSDYLNWKAGEWHNVQLEWHDRKFILYIDNKLINTVSVPSLLEVNENIFIGTNQGGKKQADAVFDNIKIYGEILIGRSAELEISCSSHEDCGESWTERYCEGTVEIIKTHAYRCENGECEELETPLLSADCSTIGKVCREGFCVDELDFTKDCIDTDEGFDDKVGGDAPHVPGFVIFVIEGVTGVGSRDFYKTEKDECIELGDGYAINYENRCWEKGEPFTPFMEIYTCEKCSKDGTYGINCVKG